MAIPTGNHNDWLPGFQWIPRSWTAVESDTPPEKIAGTATGNLDIPKPGEWVLAWPLYLAITLKNGWHFRIGAARYDYVDHYYQVGTLSVKKLVVR